MELVSDVADQGQALAGGVVGITIGFQRPYVSVRSVHTGPHALGLVPVAGLVNAPLLEQVCVKPVPWHTVDVAGP